jgi:hypothetical protein
MSPYTFLILVNASDCVLEIITYSHELDAEKPEEWDDEEDGEWVAPTISNPKCEDAPGCGEWKR